ncbi:MAG TPA: hypothetical protein VFQ70_01370 [Candidatus Saccharimonadaceae bacterium]|nr:hypothetical protein [Candidatus Saccharimonadaceae bacterium]
MKRRFSALAASVVGVATVLATNIVLTAQSSAFDGTIQQGASSAKGAGQPTDLFGSTGIFTTITNVLLYLVGAISVIMIIIGGIRYVISGGDSSNVSAAKNTILYAVVGIIVALLGYAIVNFVIGSFATGSGVGGTGGGSGF